MAEKIRIDRFINPFRVIVEKGHTGKALRTLSEQLKIQFPYFPSNAKICSNCRKKAQSISMPNDLQTKNIENELEENNISLNEKITDSDLSKRATTTAREIELEELLTGLKEKFSSLEGNDPLKIRILTIAPNSWSINKIAKEFHCSRRLAKNSKIFKNSGGVLAETIAKSRKIINICY